MTVFRSRDRTLLSDAFKSSSDELRHARLLITVILLDKIYSNSGRCKFKLRITNLSSFEVQVRVNEIANSFFIISSSPCSWIKRVEIFFHVSKSAIGVNIFARSNPPAATWSVPPQLKSSQRGERCTVFVGIHFNIGV